MLLKFPRKPPRPNLHTCRYLLNYGDHASKWYDNHPLKHRTADAIAYGLAEIFSRPPHPSPPNRFTD